MLFRSSSDASTNCDREVQNALLMLNVSRILPYAGTSTSKASSVMPIPSSDDLKSQHSDPRMHYASVQPAQMTSEVHLTSAKDNSATAAATAASASTAATVAPSMSLEVDSDEYWAMSLEIDSDEYWELLEPCSGGASIDIPRVEMGRSGTMDDDVEAALEMELRVKALLLQQADLEKVGYV